MSALGTALQIARHPLVRAIIAPLAAQLVAWIRGGKRPPWLGAALRAVPDLRAPIALAEAEAAEARKRGGK